MMQTTTTNSNNELLTKKEAASLLRISVRTLDLWMRRGVVPYLKIGRTVRLRRSALFHHLSAKFERSPA